MFYKDWAEHKDFENVCEQMVAEDLGLDRASKKFGIPKSTIHYRVHQWVIKDDPDLYRRIMEMVYRHKLFSAGNATKIRSERARIKKENQNV